MIMVMIIIIRKTVDINSIVCVPIASLMYKYNNYKTGFEPPHDKTNKMVRAPSEDLDQLGHLPSLIRVFAVLMKKATH